MSHEDYRPDREINHRVLVRLTIGLVVLVVLALILMWRLTATLDQRQVAEDPPPPIMAEARVPHQPPDPRLQSDPYEAFALYRAATEERLSSYGWSDEGRSLAHIPIERAIEIVAEQGLPAAPTFDQTAEQEPEN